MFTHIRADNSPFCTSNMQIEGFTIFERKKAKRHDLLIYSVIITSLACKPAEQSNQLVHFIA